MLATKMPLMMRLYLSCHSDYCSNPNTVKVHFVLLFPVYTCRRLLVCVLQEKSPGRQDEGRWPSDWVNCVYRECVWRWCAWTTSTVHLRNKQMRTMPTLDLSGVNLILLGSTFPGVEQCLEKLADKIEKCQLQSRTLRFIKATIRKS